MDQKYQQLKSDFPNLRFEVPLSDFTTLQIGGPAKAFIEVKNRLEMTGVIAAAKQLDIPFLIIGGGSNLLVSDQGVNSLVIKDSASDIQREDEIIKVQAGTVLQELVDTTIGRGLAGIHKMTGIPGTVAGAIYGNAGAYGQTISDHLVEVVCFNPHTLTEQIIAKSDCGFAYRESHFKSNHLIILEAHFKFPEQSSEILEKESAEVLKLRQQKYKPGVKCPGSFFKNVLSDSLTAEVKAKLPDYKDTYGKIPAWVFLDEVGAPGQRLGNIEIAPFHGNLFINLGEGKASDFWQLASIYQQKVYQKFNVKLEPEVQLIGLPPLGSK